MLVIIKLVILKRLFDFVSKIAIITIETVNLHIYL